MKTEDISIGVWTVVEGRDEVLKGGASVVRKFLEKNLGLLFRKGPHGGEMQLFPRYSPAQRLCLIIVSFQYNSS